METSQKSTGKEFKLKHKIFASFCILSSVSFLSLILFFNLIQGETALIVTVGVILFLLNLLLSYIILSKLLNPLEKLNESFSQLSKGTAVTVFDIKSGDEIGQLARSATEIQQNISFLSGNISDVAENIKIGDFFSRLQPESLQGQYKNISNAINDIITNFMFYLDELTMSVVITDKDFKIRFINKHTLDMMGSPPPPIGIPCHKIFNTACCNTENCAMHIAMKTGKSAVCNNTVQMGDVTFYIQNTGIPIRNSKGEIVGALELTYDISEMINTKKKAEQMLAHQQQGVEHLVKKLGLLADGHLDLDSEIGIESGSGHIINESFKKLNDSLYFSVSNIKSYLDELSSVLSAMSNHNMNISITRGYIGDFVSIKNSVNGIVNNINNVLSDFKVASDKAYIDALNIKQSTHDLTEGLNEQSNSVGIVRQTITTVSSQTQKNADNSLNASKLSNVAKNVAQDGNKQIDEMVLAMEDIKKSSNDIANIIKVIEEIAFQTNLLALNAAVEASRAGEHGKGFAVVAAEVRNLASKSAVAAKETAERVDDSLRKVNIGSNLANTTSKMFYDIVSSVTDTAKIVDEITKASIDQAKEISRIEESMAHISNITSSNLLILEKNTATSEDIATQSLTLKQMIDEFDLLK